MTSEPIEPAYDVMPEQSERHLPAITPESMNAEAALRDELATRIPAVLNMQGAVVSISGQKHYTRKALLTMAGYLNVSCDFHEEEWTRDPLNDDAAAVKVRCIASRADGVSQSAIGYVSSAETQWNKRERAHVPRWTDAHAMVSMAQTRAQVRALNALMLPAIVQADLGVSATPAEDMPNTPAEPEPRPEPFYVSFSRNAAAAGWVADDGTIERACHDMQQAMDAGRLTKSDIASIQENIVAEIRAGEIGKDEAWAALGQALEGVAA